MKKLTKHPFMWLWCMLLFLPFLVASPSNAQCNMTSGQLDAVMARSGLFCEESQKQCVLRRQHCLVLHDHVCTG